MAEQSFPFDRGSADSVTEAQWRLMAQAQLTNGVCRAKSNNAEFGTLNQELQVFADDTGMRVKVRGGVGFVQGHFYYLPSADAPKIVTIANNTDPNPRKDRIVLRFDDDDKEVVIAVLEGSPAVSPSAPALTQSATVWEESLAVVDVPSGETSIEAIHVADDRCYAHHPSGIYAWARFNGDSTAAITGGVNMTSITDHGTGDYTFTFRRSVASANYFVSGLSGNAYYMSQDGAVPAVGSIRIRSNDATASPQDTPRAFVGVWADR